MGHLKGRNNILIHHRLRATDNYSKTYLDNLVRSFSNIWADYHEDSRHTVTGVEICKQDQRGLLSISVNGPHGVIWDQRVFQSQKECVQFMLGYLRGFEAGLAHNTMSADI